MFANGSPLDDDDILSAKMGRFSEADEKMFEGLVSKKASLWNSYGKGRYHVDFKRPGYSSTRPSTKQGAQSFTFAHRTFAKRRIMEPKDGRTYFEARVRGSGILKEAGAKWDRYVRIGGKPGGHWLPSGSRAPKGSREIPAGAVQPAITGVQPSTAFKKQEYIEREGSLETDEQGEINIGTVATTKEDRVKFWKDVAQHERAGGRIQSTIIAELPYEKEIGPEGRRYIVEQLGAEFDELGLKWHAVVHLPDDQSDERNYHLHLLYHDRAVLGRLSDSTWQYADKKSEDVRSDGFITKMRTRYAEIVNEEFERAGHVRRYDPRTYEEMEIEKIPGRHLGSAAMALERRGVVTPAGKYNHYVEWAYRANEFLKGVQVSIEGDVDRMWPSTPSLQRAAKSHSPSLRAKATPTVLAIQTFIESTEEFRIARAEAEKDQWRSHDMRLRPKRAAANGPDADIRTDAQAILNDLDNYFERRENENAELVAKAKRKRQDSLGTLKRETRELDATFLLRDRNVLARLITTTEDSLPTKGSGPAGALKSEAQWQQEGRSMDVEHVENEKIITTSLQHVARYIQDTYGETDSGVYLAMLRERKQRKALAEEMTASLIVDNNDQGEQHLPLSIMDSFKRLQEAEARSFTMKGRRKRRARLEGLTGEARGRYIIDNAVHVSALQKVEVMKAELALLDVRIMGSPTALSLAQRQGLELKSASIRQDPTAQKRSSQSPEMMNEIETQFGFEVSESLPIECKAVDVLGSSIDRAAKTLAQPRSFPVDQVSSKKDDANIKAQDSKFAQLTAVIDQAVELAHQSLGFELHNEDRRKMQDIYTKGTTGPDLVEAFARKTGRQLIRAPSEVLSEMEVLRRLAKDKADSEAAHKARLSLDVLEPISPESSDPVSTSEPDISPPIRSSEVLDELVTRQSTAEKITSEMGAQRTKTSNEKPKPSPPRRPTARGAGGAEM